MKRQFTNELSVLKIHLLFIFCNTEVHCFHFVTIYLSGNGSRMYHRSEFICKYYFSSTLYSSYRLVFHPSLSSSGEILIHQNTYFNMTDFFVHYFFFSAWFLSDNAPFHFKGFSIMCAGFATVSSTQFPMLVV